MSKLDSIKNVVWDGDNTIWGWVEYAVPAYEAMCTWLAKFTGKSEDETAAAMNRFYTAAGALEDERLVQGLHAEGFFREVRGFDLGATILELKRIFTEVRIERLKVYEGVQAVMQRFQDAGARQIILTDAPGVQAILRLRRSGLREYIESVHAMPYAEIEDLPPGITRYRRQKGDPTLHMVDREKPHSDLEKILGETREAIAANTIIIGDNGPKDMVLADEKAWLGFHTLYGGTPPSISARLGRFIDRNGANRNLAVDPTAVHQFSDRIIPVNHPSEISRHFN